nr:CopD family protein [Halogranum amylolyticum]
MSALSHLAVRWLHVFGMAVTVGGALFAWSLLRDDTPSTTALVVATAYERLFWGAMGLLVMTGVGNLGALTPSVPGGTWGTALSAKLLLVALLLLGSLVRSLLVVDARRRPDAETVGTAALRVGYAATALVLGVVVVFAEVLAHG